MKLKNWFKSKRKVTIVKLPKEFTYDYLSWLLDSSTAEFRYCINTISESKTLIFKKPDSNDIRLYLADRGYR
jgi:hypothetical protein